MIAGTIIFEDLNIQFACKHNKASVTVSSAGHGDSYECEAEDFLIALSIAMHPDGAPAGTEEEWASAEKAQPKSRRLRFIP